MELRYKAIYVFALLAVSVVLEAQLSFDNYLEYRYGNIPGEAEYLHGHYDQFNASYSYRAFTGSLRYEHFFSQIPDASYFKLSKYQLQYEKKGFTIEIGNFEETLGNGLLFQSFDIPDVIFEEYLYRVRYGLYRDIRGVSAGYRGKYFRIKALRGATLDYTSPPVQEEGIRRRDITYALETGIEYYGQSAGLILLRNTIAEQQETFYSFALDGGFLNILRYKFEFAHDLARGMPVFQRSNLSRYGVYFSLSYSLGNVDLSWDHNNYHGMTIGSGINLPRIVMKEHSYLLLNRRMHVPIISNEKGSEFEASYSFNRKTSLLLNYTRILNQLYSVYRYRELFAEIEMHPLPLLEIKVFADYSEEPFLNENRRYTGGLIWDYNIRQRHNAGIDIQYQLVSQDFSPGYDFFNLAIAASCQLSKKFKATFTWEMSDDPTYTVNTVRNWYNAEFSVFFRRNNEFTVFAGKRRGAQVYTSGIFYDELDFEGIELRLKTEF